MTDTVKLGSVVQLSPHGETEKLTIIGKNDEGEDLVSLDDMYEVSGQESINIIIKNATAYFKHNKLSLSGMTALKISGCENFVPGYDRFNARKGGEGFLENIKNGFVTMVKAIMKWIKALIDWGVNKVKSLFGFAKTEKEISAAVQYSEHLNVLLHNYMVRSFGGTVGGKLFNLDEFVKALPPAVTSKEAINLIKNRADSNKDAVERLTKASDKIKAAQEALMEGARKSRNVKSNYRRIVDQFARQVKSNDLTEGDIVAFGDKLNDLVMIDLSVDKHLEMADKLIEDVYGIKIEGLGIEGGFKRANDVLKNMITQVKASVPEDELQTYKAAKDSYLKRIKSGDGWQITGDWLKELRDVVNDKDADLIKEVSEKYPNSDMLLGSYLEFSQKISRYNESVNILAEVLQRIAATSSSITKWLGALSALGAAYAVGDVKTILAAHQEHTPGTPDNVFFTQNSSGEPEHARLLPNEMKILNHYYPGLNIQEEILEYTRAASELPEIKKIVNNALRDFGVPMKV